MNAKILSLNIGHPEPMEWNGKSIVSSMKKTSVPGPLLVHEESIEGNSFANPSAHGTKDFLLYAYGLPSALSFANRIGLTEYVPGSTGETVTLDDFDEMKVSVGDIFSFGEVVAQACFPRIPCGKVNYRMQHERGQKAMQECGRSGVYLRILQAGKIHRIDAVRRIESAKHTFTIFELYQLMLRQEPPSSEQFERAMANGAFPKKYLDRWKA